MIWNPQFECQDAEERRLLQLGRLKNLVETLYSRVAFYRDRFDAAGLKPRDLKSLADIAKFPFTVKDDLRVTYPYGLLACGHSEIEEIHMSSGTTGVPVVDAYTRYDVECWEEAMARTLSGAGATRHDTVQNCYGYGLFTGGMGVHYGAKRIGANIVPMSSGNTPKQLMVMRDFGSTILCSTPSYALFMAEEAKETGFDFKAMKIKAGCFGAEPWSENMRKEIETKLGIDAYDIYGLTEITGPGVAFECECKDGMHVNEDLFYPEIIDPETGMPLGDGEKGELVFTTLVKEGTPLLRYRTRDVTILERGTCACGRTTAKIRRLFGRTDDMLIIRGVNVFPSQIEHALIEIEGTDPNYVIVLDRGANHLDEVELQVEVKRELFTDETRSLEALKAKIESVMKSKLGIQLRVKLVEPKTIERSVGKAKRVIDRRKI